MDNKFQPNFDIFRLYDENHPPPQVTKVGILPFIPAPLVADWQVLLMKPKAEAKHMGEPSFQLAKGTRRLFMNDRWCDMREDDLRYADASFYEPLVDTALREGHEEIGLKPSNIAKLYDLGGFAFRSTSKKILKPLHMFAAAIRDKDDFAVFEHTTEAVKWMRPQELAAIERPDHIVILEEILERLVETYAQF